jgi:AraC-like DNA-binding protein
MALRSYYERNMAKIQAVDVQGPGSPTNPRADQTSFRHVLESIRQAIPLNELVVLTSLPRGTLQIAQPARVPEVLIKAYAHDAHAQDRLSWRAILKGKVVTEAEVFGAGFESNPFFTHYLEPAGLRYALAAPLSSPVLDGYPGAIHLYRSKEQGPFSTKEAGELREWASQIDAAASKSRDARRTGACRAEETPWIPNPRTRQFIIDAGARPFPKGNELDELDERLRQQIAQHARNCLSHVNGEVMTGYRLQLPAGNGGLWNFRVVLHREYPAIGDGPFVFYCIQPGCCDWGLLRSTDFQADPELSRLIPAMRFMQQEFHRSPTLKDISKHVHLSPFHFHRRFTELLGLTPKHFLLDCQIFEAKRQLMEQRKELVQIAKDCGFAHQSHFTSRFKQATGLTPTRWRRVNLAQMN